MKQQRITAAFFVAAVVCGIPARAKEAHDRLSAMSQADRNGFFSLAMQRSGESCGKVTKSFYMGSDKQKTATWSLHCSNGHEVAVSMKADATGSSRISDCSVLKNIAGVPCFRKFK